MFQRASPGRDLPKTRLALLRVVQASLPTKTERLLGGDPRTAIFWSEGPSLSTSCSVTKWSNAEYPLVNIQKTMDNHHFQWVNPQFLWAIFNSYVSHYQRVSHPDFQPGWNQGLCHVDMDMTYHDLPAPVHAHVPAQARLCILVVFHGEPFGIWLSVAGGYSKMGCRPVGSNIFNLQPCLHFCNDFEYCCLVHLRLSEQNISANWRAYMCSQILQGSCCINNSHVCPTKIIGLRPPLPWSIIYIGQAFSWAIVRRTRISGLPEVSRCKSWWTNWWVLSGNSPRHNQPRKYQPIPPCIMLCNCWVYNIYIYIYVYIQCVYIYIYNTCIHLYICIYIPCIMYINYTLYRWLSIYNGSLHIPSWKNTPPVASGTHLDFTTHLQKTCLLRPLELSKLWQQETGRSRCNTSVFRY